MNRATARFTTKGRIGSCCPRRRNFRRRRGTPHTALHELAHATGHKDRLNRPTLEKHEGFGSESYAREELRAEMAAMNGRRERLGVGHEPRHGTSYVASWVKAVENDPREIRLAAVDAQKACDWLCERERTMEREPTIERPSTSPDLLPPQPSMSRPPEPERPSPDMERDVGPSR